MRVWLIVLVLLVSLTGAVSAQDTATPPPTETATPTITPTPTNTPTPTPDIQAVWTLPPANATLEGTPGTPEPGQAVLFEYRVDAGQTMTNILLFGILVVLLIDLVLKVWRK